MARQQSRLEKMQMLNLSEETMMIAAIAMAVLMATQLLIGFLLLISFRRSSSERDRLYREMIGLAGRIDERTAERREKSLRHYDRTFEQLSNRIPAAIASRAGNVIFETESLILTKLAELEPNLKHNQASRAKFDQLISSMERLEQTVVHLATEAARDVMLEGREVLTHEMKALESKAAA